MIKVFVSRCAIKTSDTSSFGIGDTIAIEHSFKNIHRYVDRLCGLVFRVLGYRSGVPGSIPGTTRKKK
jgi:hypothetical protein